MVSVELNIAQSEVDLIDAIVLAVAGVKAKKNVAEIAMSEVTNLMKIAGEFSTIGADVAASDKTDVSFYLIKQVEKALA